MCGIFCFLPDLRLVASCMTITIFELLLQLFADSEGFWSLGYNCCGCSG